MRSPGTPLVADSARTQAARTACSGLPSNALAIVGNATVVNNVSGSNGGFVTLHPSSAMLPTVLNLNYVPGQIVPNSFVVGLGAADGAFNIYATTSINFIADLTGYFAP